MDKICSLSSLSSDSSGQLDVLGHDGDTLGMDSTQVGVLKQTNQVSLTGLLESHDSRGLESQISLEVLGNFSDQTLEWQLSDEKLSRLLVSSDLSESNSSWSVSVRLLDSSGGGSRFSGSLGGQLLPGGLSSSGFSSCLLGTSHVDSSNDTDDVDQDNRDYICSNRYPRGRFLHAAIFKIKNSIVLADNTLLLKLYLFNVNLLDLYT